MAQVPPPVRSGLLRRIAIRGGIALVVLLALVWFAPAIVANTGLKRIAISEATTDLNGSAEVGELSLGWLSPVEMRDVAVKDASGKTVLVAERVTTSRTLLDLLLDHSDVGTIAVEKPVVSATFANGSTNLEDVIAKYLKDDGPTPTDRTAVAIVVTDGQVKLLEEGRETALDKVRGTIAVPRSRGEPITAKISAETTAAGRTGTVDLAIEAGPTTHLELTASEFATENLGPLVRRFAPGTTLAGRLTAKVAANWGTDDAGRTKADVEGTVQMAMLDLSGPWLGGDRIRLDRIELPAKGTVEAGQIRIERAKLTCDFGDATASGVYSPNESFDQLLSRAGVRVSANVDLAKLAAVLPKLLLLKEGTALTKGHIAVQLASNPHADGVIWDGSIRTTAIEGTRDGQKLVWDQPLRAEFLARMRPDGTPQFDKLECQSDFIGLAARGNPEQFVAAANINLDRLTARLADFIDLGGRKLEGLANVTMQIAPRPGGGSSLTAGAKLTRFAIADATGRGLRESELALAAQANWAKQSDGVIRLDSATATVTAGGDELQAKLLDPVADIRTARTGNADVRVAGDFAFWWARLGTFVALPKGYQLGGNGTLQGIVHLTEDGATVDKATAKLANARFRGAGLVIDERELTAESNVVWSRKAGDVTLSNARLAAETANLTSERIDFRPTADSYGVVGRATVTADASRVQRMLQLQFDPTGNDTIQGTIRGTVAVDSMKGPVAFDGDLLVERFVFGLTAKPTWREPWVKLVAKGEYDLVTDSVRFQSAKVERDGLAVNATGGFLRIFGTQDLDLTGTLTYDLAKLEPQVRDYLGKDGKLVGHDTQPFKLAGSLGSAGQSAAVTVARPKTPTSTNDSLLSLHGNAAFAWQAIRAHGFDVGPSTLQLRIDRGVVTANPVEATFGGGKVRLDPTVNLASTETELSFAKGRIVEKARLTPEVCANALGYAVPAFANSTKADGLVSFDLDENRVPLGDPEKAAISGRLTLHTATVSPGPVVAQIATLLGVTPPTLNLATERVVPVRLDKGRVYHENFAIPLGHSEVKTSGSVGLDGTLALVLDLPLPQRAIESGLAKNPKIRDLLLKQRVKVPLLGTLAKPQLDAKAFEVAVEAAVRSIAKDAAQSVADDLVKKGQDKLLEELQKKFGPPKK